MSKSLKIAQVYKDIFNCKDCSKVERNELQRKVIQSTLNSNLVLIAQAPSEKGVRCSGIHWIDKYSNFRVSGRFLHKRLKEIGYGIDPTEIEKNLLKRPYTTNILQCWTGKEGKRDRQPVQTELQNCSKWVFRELEILQPKVVILLGKSAASFFFEIVGNLEKSHNLSDMLIDYQKGKEIAYGSLTVKCFVLPHPTAPYKNKANIYKQVFKSAQRLVYE